MLNSPINKTKNNITNTLCSSPLVECCCFTAGLKSSLNLCIEIKKQQTANERGHQFPGLVFTKSEGKQQVCYLKTSATSFYDNA